MEFIARFFLVQYLTCCMLFDLSHGSAIMGKNVRDAKPGELLNVVSIGRSEPRKLTLEERQFCTGTLISKRHVLTAAHCMFEIPFNDVVITIGSENLYEGKRYYVDDWITYDEWSYGSDIDDANQLPDNDIGILTLHRKVTLVLPAKLLKFVLHDLFNSKIRIAGWGSSEDGTIPSVLKTAIVNVMSNDKCSRLVESLINETTEVSDIYFCSRAVPWILSSCGDSGAPLFNKHNQLVGINMGACPDLKKYNYQQEFVYQNQVNFHLHLYHYRYFIDDVISNPAPAGLDGDKCRYSGV